MKLLRDSFHLFVRDLRSTLRMPVFVVISIVQPVVWLLLFGALFGAVTRLPEFGDRSFTHFLAPGVAIMSALFSAAFSGMGMIRDMDRGVLDRVLSTPVSRGAVIGGRVLHAAATVVFQAAVILGVAALAGVSPEGGVAGVAAVLLAAGMLGAAVGAGSNGLALLTGRQEVLLGITNLTILPLTFLSSMIMARELMPGWIRAAAAVNPVDWAVTMAREGFNGGDLEAAAVRFVLLAGFTAASWALSALAFRSYRARS